MSEVRGNISARSNADAILQSIAVELQQLGEHLSGRMSELAPKGANAALAGSYDYGFLKADSGVTVLVGSPLEYGEYVEFGTRPHWAPIGPLIHWVENKLQPHVLAVGVEFEPGQTRSTGRATRQLRGDSRVREIIRVARAVQRKIAAVGTKPQHVIRQALEEAGLEYEVQGTDYQVNLQGWLEGRWSEILRRAGASES